MPIADALRRTGLFITCKQCWVVQQILFGKFKRLTLLGPQVVRSGPGACLG